MKRDKYVAMDVDSANIVAGVYDSEGKTLMQCCIKNEGKAIQEFLKLLPGRVHVTFEEGTQAEGVADCSAEAGFRVKRGEFANGRTEAWLQGQCSGEFSRRLRFGTGVTPFF